MTTPCATCEYTLPCFTGLLKNAALCQNCGHMFVWARVAGVVRWWQFNCIYENTLISAIPPIGLCWSCFHARLLEGQFDADNDNDARG